MKKVLINIILLFTFSISGMAQIEYGKTVEISKEVLLDKIKGGWAGQTIGCTYGGPTEFKYRGAIIHEKTPIIWYDDYCKDIFAEDPGLYDDVYMDLTFLEVMQKEGINAPAESFAKAFANADYKLWHANQAARYNILHGIMPPASGHWKNNPHADDIDFQIEADFIGMICPGMVNIASNFSDKIGHIMNYGDGWYGGVYMGAMYALAYVNNDIYTIITEALKTIPEQSKFHRCIIDVIKYWKQYPDDWRKCWLEIENRHALEIGCPEGVFNAFNIDATINAAYCVMGLLYGNGDFFKTMDIATRCGQDSDCNPATAARSTCLCDNFLQSSFQFFGTHLFRQVFFHNGYLTQFYVSQVLTTLSDIDFSRIFSLFYKFLDNLQSCVICQYIVSSRSCLSFEEELLYISQGFEGYFIFRLHCVFNVFADLIE